MTYDTRDFRPHSASAQRDADSSGRRRPPAGVRHGEKLRELDARLATIEESLGLKRRQPDDGSR